MLWTSADTRWLRKAIGDVHTRLDQQAAYIRQLITQGRLLMTAIDTLRDKVARLTSVTDGAVTVLADISQRLKDALENDDVAALEQLASDIDSNADKLAKAIVENTPAAPTAPETPTG